jgi:YVTN family beta-propeller protein
LAGGNSTAQFTFAVTASQTIINRDYWVSADSSFVASGPPVTTMMGEIYLPYIRKSFFYIGPLAYITNCGDDTVSVIDTARDIAVATIPVGDCPFGVAVNPTGTRVYLGGNDISIIDTNMHQVIATIDYGGFTSVAVNPAISRVYFGDYGGIWVMDAATHNGIAGIGFQSGEPFGFGGVAVNPAGTRVYAVGPCGSPLYVIDAATNSVIETVPLGGGYSRRNGVAVHPAGTRVYVTSWNNNLYVVDTATNSVIATVTVGEEPEGVAVNPAGTRVYVANWFSDSVSVIDTATNTVIKTISVGDGPRGIAVNPAGTKVYVANSVSDTVSVNTATNTVVKTIPVGRGPYAFGKFIGP